jgi:glutamate synthase domain-containing protein 3
MSDDDQDIFDSLEKEASEFTKVSPQLYRQTSRELTRDT